METNRNARSALNLARYLVERKERLDPEWRTDARNLIDLVLARFVTVRWGITVCGEQDDDKDPWGGALTNFGGPLADYAAATGFDEFKGLAHAALTLACTPSTRTVAPRFPHQVPPGRLAGRCPHRRHPQFHGCAHGLSRLGQVGGTTHGNAALPSPPRTRPPARLDSSTLDPKRSMCTFCREHNKKSL